MFFLRRFLFVIFIFSFQNYSMFQVFGFIAINNAYFYATVYIKPYKKLRMYRLEIVNEFCISLAGYMLISFVTFDDTVSKTKQNHFCGFIYILILCFDFGINILVITYFTLKRVFKSMKRLYIRINKKIKSKRQVRSNI